MVTKTPTSTPDVEENSLHRKYRPQELSRIIGHEAVVTRLRGMIATGKIPNALAFFGPPSAGKTTLGRCVATEVNQKPVKFQQDFKEINAATQKGIDDIRELDRISRFRAISKHRFILIDETQMLLTNKQAAQALLKPLEEPSKDTTWIICSMDPAKFKTTDEGRAILSRCTQFVLEPPSSSDVLKYLMRIAKGENMTYVIDEEKTVLKEVVRSCEQSLRTAANLMQGLQQYYDGIEGKKPKILTKEHVVTVLSSVESSDDALALQYMIALYSKDFAKAQRALLDMNDGFSFCKKIVWLSQFMLNVKVLDGEKHRKVWWSPANRELLNAAKSLKLSFDTLAAVNARLVRIQSQALSFQIPAPDLLSSETWYLMKELGK
jgi:DNA polymerase III gamma/tau subunit